MIWIDPPVWAAHGRLWSHVISDASVEELHAFAARTHLPSRSFEGDHYDVPAERHAELVAAGAEPTSGGDLARRLRDSGLRFRKRRGERPLARIVDGLAAVGGRHTLEVVASTLEPPASSGAAVVLVHDGEGHVVLVRSHSRPGWAPPGGKREPGETIRACAVREVAEETGLQLDPVLLSPVGYERVVVRAGEQVPPWDAGDNHIAVYAARVSRRPVRPVADDVAEAGWVPVDTVRQQCGSQPWWVLVDHWLWRLSGAGAPS